MIIRIAQIIIVLVGIFSTLSFAEKDTSLPLVELQGQTQFISGGIGKDESEAILQAGKSWSLMLELTQETGSKNQYISDVHILIKDKMGNTVLDTTTEGPYLLVNLAAGSYSLNATYESTTLQRDLIIHEKNGKKITLIWPATRN
ncbi:hypothetical protein [Nitrosomonas supralitoralis]|uniref:Carboxypeptidase regulatory-like domain-containing protein n=1 Tax=Nitrosomonas supralitoralis TaxID=2116706 RepID=A0A2P7NSI6_9PROT|nr:hypothetical protein [Nitrosomonas supralitoralis]PSJ16409.1 hypothetical protein C7H79_13535 [Nitrosomonas supralitoralis]